MTTDTISLETYGFVKYNLYLLRAKRSLTHRVDDEWPVEPGAEMDALYSSRSLNGGRWEGFANHDDGVIYANIDGNVAHVTAYGATPDCAAALLERAREELPRATQDDPDVVTVTFWTLSSHGPHAIRRSIDAPAWDEIAGNYPDGRDLASLVHDWKPGVGGQLLLWHGDAGTGKTTALRSIGREWRDWADLHYIVDPEAFFGDSASYMMTVMMGSENEDPFEIPVRPTRERQTGSPRWRLLILEDCGEMLQPDARNDVGQALSRLLNACDGLIGRGLRLLVLITTNEPLKKIHPAVARPGRCATLVRFRRFSAEQAVAWLGESSPLSSPTLADLYSIRAGHTPTNGRPRVGFAAEGSRL